MDCLMQELTHSQGRHALKQEERADLCLLSHPLITANASHWLNLPGSQGAWEM